LKLIKVFMAGVLLAVILAPGTVPAAGASYVIGRLTGTHRELPGYFRNNMRLYNEGTDRVEFTGFRLLRVEDGRKFIIRPNHEGFFYQKLPGGEYSLMRKRTDRPGYREPGTIDIMRFGVKPGTLVNLGTVHIVLNGDPLESLRLYPNSSRGTYIYSYRYERERGDGAWEAPLTWFRQKNRRAAHDFESRVVLNDAELTGEGDGSRVILREIIPRQFR